MAQKKPTILDQLRQKFLPKAQQFGQNALSAAKNSLTTYPTFKPVLNQNNQSLYPQGSGPVNNVVGAAQAYFPAKFREIFNQIGAVNAENRYFQLKGNKVETLYGGLPREVELGIRQPTREEKASEAVNIGGLSAPVEGGSVSMANLAKKAPAALRAMAKNRAKVLSKAPKGVGEIDLQAQNLMKTIRNKFGNIDETKLLANARKIADVNGNKKIMAQDLAEAVQYRSFDPDINTISAERLFSKEGGLEIYKRKQQLGITEGLDPGITSLVDNLRLKLGKLDDTSKNILKLYSEKKLGGSLDSNQLKKLNSIIGDKPTLKSILTRLQSETKSQPPKRVGEIPIPKTPLLEAGKLTTNVPNWRVPNSMLLPEKAGEITGNLVKTAEELGGVIEKGVKSKFDPRTGGKAAFIPDDIPDIGENLYKGSGTVREGIGQIMNLWVKSGERALNSMGVAGKFAAKQLNAWNDEWRLMAGGYVSKYKSIIKDLSQESMALVNRFLDGQDVKLTTPLRAKAAQLRGILNEYADEAARANLKITHRDGTTSPFAPLKDFLPRFIDKKAFAANKQKVIDYLVKKGTLSRELATDFANSVANGMPVGEAYHRYFNPHIPKRYGHLEMSRVLDLPPEVYRYDKAVIADYLEAAAGRIKSADYFGADGERIEQMLTPIQAEAGEGAAQVAQKIFDIAFDRAKSSPADRVMNASRSVMAAVKLPLAAVSNVSQSVNTATTYGIKETIGALIDAFTPAGREFAEKTGTLLDDVMKDLSKELADPSILSKLTSPGFSFIETFNRVVAANAGKRATNNVVNQFLKNPGSKSTLRMMDKLGLDPAKILAQGGALEDDIIRAGQKAVDTSQFGTFVLNTPVAWKTPFGKFITQFKTFTYQQLEYVAKEVMGEAVHGNIKPLMRYILLGLVVGEGVGNVKAFLRGKERPKDPLARAVDNITNVGGAGIINDLFNAVGRKDKQALYEFVLGPSVATGADAVVNTTKAVTGNPQPLIKQAVTSIPVVGQSLNQPLFGEVQASVGSGFAPGKNVEQRKKQKTLITDKLEKGKGATAAELRFAFTYDSDKLPSNTAYDRAQRMDSYLNDYESVTKSEVLTDGQKSFLTTEIAKKLGVTESQLKYSHIAKQDLNDRYAFLMDRLANTSGPDDYMPLLMQARTLINGKQLLTSELINDLVENGDITYEEGQLLKKIKMVGGKPILTGRVGSKGSSGPTKAPKLDLPATKISLPKTSKNYRRIKIQGTK